MARLFPRSGWVIDGVSVSFSRKGRLIDMVIAGYRLRPRILLRFDMRIGDPSLAETIFESVAYPAWQSKEEISIDDILGWCQLAGVNPRAQFWKEPGHKAFPRFTMDELAS